MLQGVTSNDEAAQAVYEAYFSYYKERALVEMLEQAVLLWMRRDAAANWMDCVQDDGPMAYFTEHEHFHRAMAEINDRVTTVEALITHAATA